MSTNSSKKISEFYSQFPFPNISLTKKSDIYQTLIYKLIYGLTRKYLDPVKTAKILDVGCGTGELTLGLSDPGRTILGIDRNVKSLEIAKKRASKFNFTKTKFKEFDLLHDDLPKDYYDFIYAIGVLHHLPQPERTFEKLAKALKKGGIITIGIYNPYGSLQVRIKRGILKILAGNNFERKIEIYQKIFYRRPLSVQEKVAVADAFANPYRRYYTFEQLLAWFRNNNIQYLESAPPIEISRNIRLVKVVIQNMIKYKKVDLMSAWREVAFQDYAPNKWELTFPLSLFSQLMLTIIGRGELMNLVGKKIK